MQDPHHRVYAALAAIDNNTGSSDPKIALIIKTIEGYKVPAEVKYAWEQYEQEKIRIILDALLLGGASLSLIHQTTEIPINVLQAYCEYFFDASVFRNRLERYNYVNMMQRHVPPTEAMLLKSAITGGPEVLLWLLSPERKPVKHAPLDVLETMMTENMYKALAGRTAPLGSDISKRALECSNAAIKAAATIQKLNPTDAVDALAELKLALTHRDRTISEFTDGAPNPDEILH